eukprot:729392-Pyramimonas_sp.AAC.1
MAGARPKPSSFDANWGARRAGGSRLTLRSSRRASRANAPRNGAAPCAVRRALASWQNAPNNAGHPCVPCHACSRTAGASAMRR